MRRDNFVMSPLFTTTHNNGYFKGFTPTNFTPRQPLDTNRSIGINFDDFAFRMPNDNAEMYNKQLDSIVDNLKNEIQNKTDAIDHSSGQKKFDLDISLIDETYTPAPLTKSSNVFKFPVSQPGTNRSQGQSFKLMQSPNSLFSARKKF